MQGTANNLTDYIKSLAKPTAPDKFSAIVYGQSGVGKTHLLRTCRQPILVHSFDPNGSLTNRNVAEATNMIVDTRFESESAKAPTAFSLWEKTMELLESQGMFGKLGTFALDSATLWADALMNAVTKAKGRQKPTYDDYFIVQATIKDWVKRMTMYPCDFILTGHVKIDRDEVSGIVTSEIVVVGSMREFLPLLFDEMYLLTTRQTSKGAEYVLQTQSSGIYKARTRLGTGGLFEPFETPNVMELRRKAGMSTQHLPSLTTN